MSIAVDSCSPLCDAWIRHRINELLELGSVSRSRVSTDWLFF